MAFWRTIVWAGKGYLNYGKSGYEHAAQSFDPQDLKQDLSNRSFMITGANSGIGKWTALGIAKQGGQVHMVCRSKERGEKAKQEIEEQTGSKKIELHVVDVSIMKEIKQFAQSFIESGKELHVLVNNAGVLLNERSTTKEGLDASFATNLLGSFYLTNLLIPLLLKSAESSKTPSRVINVSSGGAYLAKLDVEDLQFKNMKKWDGAQSYSQTKRGQIILTEMWAEKYKGQPLKFYSMHPGWADTPGVQSSLPGFREKMRDKLRTEEQGADTVLWLSAAPEKSLLEEYNGKFFLDRKPQAYECISKFVNNNFTELGLAFLDSSTHLPLSFTESSPEEREKYWKQLIELCESSEHESNAEEEHKKEEVE